MLEAVQVPSQREKGYLANLRNQSRHALGLGVYDAFGAKNAAEVGADVLWLGSLEVSTAKALPDRNMINATQLTTAIGEIRQACTVPILIDGDNGYGSDENAQHAAVQFALAGAAGIVIEDNVFPKTNSLLLKRRRLLECDEFAARVAAVRDALDERRLAFDVIARTEALVAHLGEREALARCAAYLAAGADGLFVQFNADSIAQFKRVLPSVAALGPTVIAPTKLETFSFAEFTDLGADVVIHANAGARCRALHERELFARLVAGERLADVRDELMPLEDFLALNTSSHTLSTSQVAS